MLDLGEENLKDQEVKERVVDLKFKKKIIPQFLIFCKSNFTMKVILFKEKNFFFFVENHKLYNKYR